MKKSHIKHGWLLACAALPIILLTACFSPLGGYAGKETNTASPGTGAIRVSFADRNSASRAMVNPQELNYILTFSSPENDSIVEEAGWGETVTVWVNPGTWNVNVTAYDPDDPNKTLKAIGETYNIEVITGIQSDADVTMAVYSEAGSWEDLRTILENSGEDYNQFIVLAINMQMDDAIDVLPSLNVEKKTITLAAKNNIRLNSTGEPIFNITDGAHLILGSVSPDYSGGIEVSGYNRYDACINIDENGQFTMNSGTISNGNNCIVNEGIFVMNGGIIEKGDSGVFNNGTFTMHDGIIRLCYSGVDNTETFTMNGGYITENENGVWIRAFVDRNTNDLIQGTFNMNSGYITENTENGVYISSFQDTSIGGDPAMGTFIMSGGTVMGNAVSEYAYDIVNYGNFSIYGSAIAGSVFLEDDLSITVPSELTGNSKSTVFLANFEEEYQVLTKGFFPGAEQKFSIASTPWNSYTFASKEYSLDSEGKVLLSAETWALTSKEKEGYGTASFNAVAADSEGNIYAAGKQHDLKFVYGDDIVAEGSNYNSNPVIVKYNTGGKAVWAKTADYPSDIPTLTRTITARFDKIAIDNSGRIIVLGNQEDDTYSEKLSFDGLDVPYNCDGLFIVIYDSDGKAQKVWSLGDNTDAAYATGTGIAIDSADNIYISGYSHGEIDFGSDINIGANPDDGLWYRCSFLVKYDKNGNAQWVQTGIVDDGGYAEPHFYSVTVDSQDNVYAAGDVTNAFWEELILGNGDTKLGISDCEPAIIVKYNSGAALQWAKTVSAAANEEGRSVFNTLTVYGDSVYAAGGIQGNRTYTFGRGVTIIRFSGNSEGNIPVIVKYNAEDGTALAVAGASNYGGAYFDISADASGIYASGYQNMEWPSMYDGGLILKSAGISDNAVMISYNHSLTIAKGFTVQDPMNWSSIGYSQFYGVCMDDKYLYVSGNQEMGDYNYGTGYLNGDPYGTGGGGGEYPVLLKLNKETLK